jgi:hypothetical protein
MPVPVVHLKTTDLSRFDFFLFKKTLFVSALCFNAVQRIVPDPIDESNFSSPYYFVKHFCALFATSNAINAHVSLKKS